MMHTQNSKLSSAFTWEEDDGHIILRLDMNGWPWKDLVQ